MNNFKYAFDGAYHVLIAGLILGVGLPAVFALGVRSMALGTTASDGVDSDEAAMTVLGKTLAGLCFLIVVVAVAIGITIIVASGLGKDVSFDHVYPTIVAKAK